MRDGAILTPQHAADDDVGFLNETVSKRVADVT